MILLDKRACGDLRNNLREGYYGRQNLDCLFLVCTPIGGSGPLLEE